MEKVILFAILGCAALSIVGIAFTKTNSRYGTLHRAQALFFLLLLLIAGIVVAVK